MKTFIRSLSLALVLALPRILHGAATEETLQRLDNALKAAQGFDYGADAAPLGAIEQIVIASAKDSALRGPVEERLVAALRAATTRDAKGFLCRQFRLVGTAECVPSLEALLIDPEAAHMARYVLGRLEFPEAGAALRRALARTSGPLQMGIVNALGMRRDTDAVPQLAGLLSSRDVDTAAAAAHALGEIGGAMSVRALEGVRQTASGRMRLDVDDALMACADRWVKEGNRADAARIYRMFHAAGQPAQFRIGALRGLLEAGDVDASSLLVDAIQSDDPRLRASAISFVPGMRQLETGRLMRLFPSLPTDAQALLLRALAARGDAQAAPVAVAAMNSGTASVRSAAATTLGVLGNASHLDLLARMAADTTGAEQQAARAALVELGDGAVTTAMIRAGSGGEPNARKEVIRALAGRRATDAVPALLQWATDADEGVRREAVRALGELMTGAQWANLVGLILKPRDSADRPDLERAATRVLQRMVSPDEQAAPLLRALSDAPVDARPSLLRLLAQPATPAALAAVRRAVGDADGTVRVAAERTLFDWPNAAPAEDVLRLAGATSDETLRILALRGYVRMAGMSTNATTMYVRAMELAGQPADKKLVLAGLGTAASADALQVVEPYLATRELQVEAGLAAVQIAGRLRRTDPDLARVAIKNVLAAVPDSRVRQPAQELLNEMEQYDGYLLNWQVAGPYKVRGKDSRVVFDTVFPPEKPGSGEVDWKPLTQGLGGWDINLEAQLGSEDHCGAYVRTRVWSPEEQAARLELGSDDAIKAWLNGAQVHATYAQRGLSPRQDLVAITLRQGWNDLMLKVVDHEGGWAFACRVRKPDGSALEGLKVSAD